MIKKLRFRASAIGDLMTNKQGATFTDGNKKRLEYLEGRLESKGELTLLQEKEYNELIDKRDAPFELSDTAKAMVRGMWQWHEKGVKEFLSNKYIEKGLSEEEAGISLLSELDGNLYKKNTERFDNGIFTGEPDILGPTEYVDDVKSSWSLETYMNAKMTPLYYGQLQTYMELTGRKKARLRYCLVDTPQKLVDDEKRRVMWKLGITDETIEDYQEIFAQIDTNMYFNFYPKEERVKTFLVDFNEKYISDLYYRAEAALKYYETIKLGGTFHYSHESN